MMTERVADATSETVSYAYRPSVFGAFREFSLTERGIDWAAGLRSGSIPFERVRRLRCLIGRTACSRTVS